jgi:hypothetical protein
MLTVATCSPVRSGGREADIEISPLSTSATMLALMCAETNRIPLSGTLSAVQGQSGQRHVQVVFPQDSCKKKRYARCYMVIVHVRTVRV